MTHPKKFVFWTIIAVAIYAAVLSGKARGATPSFKDDVSGHGTPMVLIPGLNSAGEVWDSTVAHYKSQYECHVLTLAGFAGQPPIPAPFLPKVESDLAAYMHEKHLEHAVVVGHSLGGYLALSLAAHHPELVGKLVIVDSLPAMGAIMNPDISPADLESNARQMRDGMLKQDETTRAKYARASVESMVTAPADLERILAWGQKSDFNTTAEAMYGLFDTDLRADLAKIQAPTLVMGTWIAYEKYATQDQIRQTFVSQFKNLKGVDIEMAPKARHFIMYDDPTWMFAQMDRFLAAAGKS